MSARQPIPLKRYEGRPDLSVDNAHARVMRLVGREKRVLELGCATGYMSRALTTDLGCVVTGVELNPAAAEEARSACARVIVGDLEAINWQAALGAEQFDVVVAADVLEHLRNPAGVLAALRPNLAPGGYVVASIPNVVHTAVLAELLQGRFTYQPFGLLDDTHIRFFTRDSIYRCFEEAGFAVTYLDRLTLEPAETEFRTMLSSFPAQVVDWLASREEATTYQFIVTAHATTMSVERALWPRPTAGAAEGAYRSVLDRLAGQPGASAVEGILRAHAARLAYLEDVRAHQVERIALLEGALAKHEGYIGAVTAESEARQNELSNAQAYTASLLAEIEKLRAELTSAGEYAAALLKASEVSEERLRQASEASEERLRQASERNRRLLDLDALQRAEIDALRRESTSAVDHAAELRHALDVSERRLLRERQRMADAMETERNRLLREGEEERVRLVQDEHRRLSSDLDERAREIERQAQVIVRLTAAIDAYERSRSWRVTAPLRAAVRLLARSARSR